MNADDQVDIILDNIYTIEIFYTYYDVQINYIVRT
jgi:hypothetical protein